MKLVTDNTDFIVIILLGPPRVGKSTILNELYVFDRNTSGVLPPFAIQSEENRAMTRHCSVGIELRMFVEFFILLDIQPILSASILAEMMRPDEFLPSLFWMESLYNIIESQYIIIKSEKNWLLMKHRRG